MDLWSHDRFTFPLPATHRFPLSKYPRLRARLEADGIARPDEIHECEPVPWEWIEAVQQPALVARLRDGTLSIREQRGLGLPWSPELVERARRTTAGTVAAARRALHRGVGMNLGGGTHHAGYDFARGYCLFNDVAVALAPRARRGRRRARAGRRLRRPPGRRDRAGPGGRRRGLHRVAARRAQLPLPAHPVRPRRRPPHRDRRRRVPARARRSPRRRAAPRTARRRLLSRRRRPLRGRPPRAPGADQGRPARPRRAGRRAPARRGRRRRRGPRRRLRARRRGHGRHQRGHRGGGGRGRRARLPLGLE